MQYSEYLLTYRQKPITIGGQQYSTDNIQDIELPEGEHFNKVRALIEFWYGMEDVIKISTSGSTGDPKQIALRKEQMYNSARMSLGYFKLEKGQKVLHVLPVDKVGGMMLVIRALIGELDLYFVKPALCPEIPQIEGGYDFCSLTPAQLAKLWEDDISSTKYIAQILLGGSVIPYHLKSRIWSAPNSFFQSYGMTETISHVAIRKLNNPFEAAYYALEGVTFDEMKPDNNLVIYAPSISNEKIVTNDIIDLFDEKTMIWYGRLDNVINSGGLKINPEVIEEFFASRISIPFYVSFLPDSVLGERIVLLIEGKEDNELKEEILYTSRTELQNDKVRDIFFVDQFDRTSNNKIKRTPAAELLNRATNSALLESNFDSLESLERSIPNIWQTFKHRNIFLLIGDLGAGKTTLVKNLMHHLGVEDSVTSPTFSIVNEYEGKSGPIYHFDLYRIESVEELEEIGFFEYLDSGNPCFIEWPEIVMDYIDLPSLQINLSILENNTRNMIILEIE